MQLTAPTLYGLLAFLRHLFRLEQLDVSRFTDEEITAAVLAICPIYSDAWPTDEQLRAVHQRLDSGCISLNRKEEIRR